MANEIIPSGIGDLIAGEVMAAEFLMLLADRDASVLTHPAFFHATGIPGSSVVRVAHLGHGADLLVADTPGSEHANTAFSDASTDVTLANYVVRYTVHDLARWMSNGKLDPVLFAQGAVTSISQTLISLVANVADGFTATAGASGVNLTWDDIQIAKGKLNLAKAQGEICAILHPVQWSDLEADALSMGVLPASSMGGVVMADLGSYKGRYMGVDFFTSSAVPTANAGADRAGCLFTRGGIVWADVQYADQGDANIINLGRGEFERVRLGNFSSTSYVIRAGMGVSLGIDGAGVSVISDA